MKNLMKTTAIAVTLALTTASLVSADAYITLQKEMMTSDQVTISNVTTTSAGYVGVYDYTTGEIGDLLGSAELMAGANSDVIVNFDTPVNGTVIAVIYNGEMTTPDMAVYTAEIEIDS